MTETIKCPRCGREVIRNTTVEGDLRSEHGGWGHDAFCCKKCSCTFTIWT